MGNFSEEDIQLIEFYKKSNLMIKTLEEQINLLKENKFEDKIFSRIISLIKDLNNMFAELGFDDILEQATIVLEAFEVLKKNINSNTLEKNQKQLNEIQEMLENFHSIYNANIDELSNNMGFDITKSEIEVDSEQKNSTPEEDEMFIMLKDFCIVGNACLSKIEELLENGLTNESLSVIEKVLMFLNETSAQLGFDDIEDNSSVFLKSILSIEDGNITEEIASTLFENFISLKSLTLDNINEIIESQGIDDIEQDIAKQVENLDIRVGFTDPFKDNSEPNQETDEETEDISEDEQEINNIEVIEDSIIKSIKETLEENSEPVDIRTEKTNIVISDNAINLNSISNEYIIQINKFYNSDVSQTLNSLEGNFLVRQLTESGNYIYLKASTNSKTVKPIKGVSIINYTNDFDFEQVKNIANNDLTSFVNTISFGLAQNKPVQDYFLQKNQFSFNLYRELFEISQAFIVSKTPNIKLSQQNYLLLSQVMTSILLNSNSKVIYTDIVENKDSFTLLFDCGLDLDIKNISNHIMLKKVSSNTITVLKSEYFTSAIIYKNQCIPQFLIKRVFQANKKSIYFDVDETCYLFEEGNLKKIGSGIKKQDLTKDDFYIVSIDYLGSQKNAILFEYEVKLLSIKDGKYFDENGKVVPLFDV